MSKNEIDAYVEDERKRHQRWLEELMERFGSRAGKEAFDYLDLHLHLLKGRAKDVIPTLTNDLGVDLLAMGTVARTAIPGFIMGNTAEIILNQVNCSVLAIKPAGFTTPVTLEG